MINYNWNLASGVDVADIVAMAQTHFQFEIDNIFTPEPITYARNLAHCVINQFYQPGTQLLTVCRHGNTNKLLAYNWAAGNERACWSDDYMINVRMVHVDLSLSNRVRITLIKDMMYQWERFASVNGNRIICSTTMRGDQSGFLELHRRNGYTIRGSYAYKKLELNPASLSIAK